MLVPDLDAVYLETAPNPGTFKTLPGTYETFSKPPTVADGLGSFANGFNVNLSFGGLFVSPVKCGEPLPRLANH